jgi:pyruvate kinase
LTARLLSKYRPVPPIFALSPYEKIIRRATLLWGTFPILCEHARSIDKMVVVAEEMLEQKAGVLSGQIVGIVAGTRTRTGATNFMRLHTMGDREAAPSKAKKTRR